MPLRSRIEYVLTHARGVSPMLFLPRTNARRDLGLGCDRVGIEPSSPNDPRRNLRNVASFRAARPLT
ncbi:MAG TPA: hypothetical protein VK509_07175 [Polyangiales bacterium]|nr:hypothetical protein [Polyangiales bacterium]